MFMIRVYGKRLNVSSESRGITQHGEGIVALSEAFKLDRGINRGDHFWVYLA